MSWKNNILSLKHAIYMSTFKKVSLLAIVWLSVFLSKAIAQDYVPFPTDSAYWKTSFHSIVEDIYKTYELSGDTTISSQVYHKIYVTSEEIIGQIGSVTFNPRSYMGAIREQDKIVYFLPSGSTAENIAYNFNLGIGDTVADEIYPCPGLFFTIASIDTVTLADGSLRKSYSLNSCGNATGGYIEGLGNAYGPLPFYGVSFGPGSYAPSLSCFTDHGTFLYPTAGSECSVLTSTQEIPTTLTNFAVYPNPFQEACVIAFGKIIQSGELKVVNELGQVVMQKTVSNTQQVTITASEISNSGIYLVTFLTGSEIVSRKIMMSR
jgi:hypothetical protein